MKELIEIHARIDAVEFLLRQLYVAEIKHAADPAETARLTQAHAAARIGAQIERMPEGPPRAHLQQVATLVQRLYETIVQAVEAGRSDRP